MLLSLDTTINDISLLEVTNYEIKALSDDQSLKLLLDKSPRKIESKTSAFLLENLLCFRNNYSRNLIFMYYYHIEFIAKEILELVKSVEGCQNLLQHPFTKYLGGHPKRIIETALKLKDQTLLEFYNTTL